MVGLVWKASNIYVYWKFKMAAIHRKSLENSTYPGLFCVKLSCMAFYTSVSLTSRRIDFMTIFFIIFTREINAQHVLYNNKRLLTRHMCSID
jgi:hypothetical protein